MGWGKILLSLLLFCGALAFCEPKPRDADRKDFLNTEIDIAYPPHYEGPDLLGMKDGEGQSYRIYPKGEGFELWAGKYYRGTDNAQFIPIVKMPLSFQGNETLRDFFKKLQKGNDIFNWELRTKEGISDVKIRKWKLIVNPQNGEAQNLIATDAWVVNPMSLSGMIKLNNAIGLNSVDLETKSIELPEMRFDMAPSGLRLISPEQIASPTKAQSNWMELLGIGFSEAALGLQFSKEADKPAFRKVLLRLFNDLQRSSRNGLVVLSEPISDLKMIDKALKVSEGLRILAVERESEQEKIRHQIEIDHVERMGDALNVGMDEESMEYARDELMRKRGDEYLSPSDEELIQWAYEFTDKETRSRMSAVRKKEVNSAAPTSPFYRDLKRRIASLTVNVPHLFGDREAKVGFLSTVGLLGYSFYDPSMLTGLFHGEYQWKLLPAAFAWSRAIFYVPYIVNALPKQVALAANKAKLISYHCALALSKFGLVHRP